ncbi:MAG: hypothetical protein Q8N96_01835 [Methylovulum sp.]|nr:hypothetical protein [Methylovulum sp.]
MARLNTSLYSTGAEFMVLGNLLIHGIQAYKAYVNHPGYDLIAVNPDNNQSCRIQVKSRYATDFDGGFPISNFDCDFVVFVALNRGYRYGKAKMAGDSGIMEPVFYVFPVNVIKAARKETAAWQKV